MNLQQAMKLLGITQEDDEREIKRKYHKMISRFHPDSLNKAGAAHIQRAQEIIKELVSNGIDKNLFTYRGFGGTKPVADNSTPQGRALNRRVEIIIMPKGSYILRE